MQKGAITKQDVEDLYLVKGLSIRACAEALGSTQGSITWFMKKHGIERRSNIVGLLNYKEHPVGDKAPGWKGGKEKRICIKCGDVFESFPSQNAVRCKKCNKGPRTDIAGMRFGKLIAIKPVEKRGTRWLWECICDC